MSINNTGKNAWDKKFLVYLTFTIKWGILFLFANLVALYFENLYVEK